MSSSRPLPEAHVAAVQNGDLTILERLEKEHALATDARGETLLHFAVVAKENRVPLCRKLLEWGANAVHQPEGEGGQTPIAILQQSLSSEADVERREETKQLLDLLEGAVPRLEHSAPSVPCALAADGSSSSTSPTAPLAAGECFDYDHSSRCLRVRAELAYPLFKKQNDSSRPHLDSTILFDSSPPQDSLKVSLDLENVSEFPVELLKRLLNAVWRFVNGSLVRTLEIHNARTMTAPSLAFLFRWLKTTQLEEFYLLRDESNPCVVQTNKSEEIKFLFAASRKLGRRNFGACFLSDAQKATRLVCVVCPHEGEQYKQVFEVISNCEFAIERVEMCNCGLDNAKIDTLIDVLAERHAPTLQSLNLQNNPFDGAGLTKLLDWLPSTGVNKLRARRPSLSCFASSFEYEPEECEHFQFDSSEPLKEAARRACSINSLLLCDAIPPPWRSELQVPVFPQESEARQWAIEAMDRPLTDYALVEVNQTCHHHQVFFRLVLNEAPLEGSNTIFLWDLKKLHKFDAALFTSTHRYSRMKHPCLLFRELPMDEQYDSILNPTDTSLGSEAFAVLLDGYFGFEWKAALPSTPLRTAAACLALYEAVPHLSFQKLVGTKYFASLQREVNSKVSKEDPLVKRLERLFQNGQQPQQPSGQKYRRNSAISVALTKASTEGLVVRGGEPYFVHASCHARDEFVWEILCQCGLKVKTGPPKKPYRLKQKYDTYASHYLSPSWPLVLHKFKDLFRGTMALDEANVKALETLHDQGDVQFRACQVKTQESGYSAVYMELDVAGCTVELQAVSSLDTSEESHLWYEIRRITEWDAVELFYCRQLKLFDAKHFFVEAISPAPVESIPAAAVPSSSCAHSAD